MQIYSIIIAFLPLNLPTRLLSENQYALMKTKTN